MKKSFIYLLSILFVWSLAGMLVGCSDDDDDTPPVEKPKEPEKPANSLTMEQQEWKFSGEADQYAIAVFANVSWKVSCGDADWCTLDKTEGTGNGVFTVSVPANTTGADRTATLTVKAVEDAALIRTFKITQEAGVLNITSKDAVEVPAAGQTVVIDVESNMDYIFEMGDWVTVAAAPAAEMSAFCAVTRSKITLNIAPNLGIEARTCDVVIKSGDKVKKTVRISQAGMPEPAEVMVVDITDEADGIVEMLSTGGFLKAKVKANIAYACEMAAWAEWDGKLAAVGEATENELSIRIMPNLETDRQTDLKFTWEESGVKKEKIVTVYQKAIEFSLTTVTVIPCGGGEGKLLLQADQGEGMAKSIFSVDLSADGVAFDPVEGESLAFGHIKVTKPSANLLSSEASILVVAEFKHNRLNCSTTKTFHILQEACPSIRIEGEANIPLGIEAGKKDFTVLPPFEGAKWNVEIFSQQPDPSGLGMMEVKCTWAEVEKKENGFTVTWQENIEAKEQTAIVRVFLEGAETNKAAVTLTQEKADVPEFTMASDINLPDYKEVQGYDILIGFAPENGWCTLEIADNPGNFVVLSGESAWKRSAGMLELACDVTENTGTEARKATFNVKLYRHEGDTEPVLTKTITLTQPGKPAVTKITATVSTDRGGTNILTMDGRPVTVIVDGASEVEWRMENGTNAGWLDVQPGGDGYWLHNRGQRAGTYVVYVIPKGAEFSADNLENYGKIELVIE